MKRISSLRCGAGSEDGDWATSSSGLRGSRGSTVMLQLRSARALMHNCDNVLFRHLKVRKFDALRYVGVLSLNSGGGGGRLVSDDNREWNNDTVDDVLVDTDEETVRRRAQEVRSIGSSALSNRILSNSKRKREGSPAENLTDYSSALRGKALNTRDELISASKAPSKLRAGTMDLDVDFSEQPRPVPAPEGWSCKHCTYQNDLHASECEMCQQPKESDDEWICGTCTMSNSSSLLSCVVCCTKRLDLNAATVTESSASVSTAWTRTTRSPPPVAGRSPPTWQITDEYDFAASTQGTKSNTSTKRSLGKKSSKSNGSEEFEAEDSGDGWHSSRKVNVKKSNDKKVMSETKTVAKSASSSRKRGYDDDLDGFIVDDEDISEHSDDGDWRNEWEEDDEKFTVPSDGHRSTGLGPVDLTTDISEDEADDIGASRKQGDLKPISVSKLAQSRFTALGRNSLLEDIDDFSEDLPTTGKSSSAKRKLDIPPTHPDVSANFW
jgi:hypothetical protein